MSSRDCLEFIHDKKSSPKIKLKWFLFLHFAGPSTTVGLGNFQRTKSKTVISLILVQQFNIPNHKTIEIISIFWYDCGLEGHEFLNS